MIPREQLCRLWPLKEEETRSGAVIGLNASDHHAAAVGDHDRHFHGQRSKPLRVDAETSTAQVGRSDAAVDKAVIPVGSHTAVVVAMKVGEKVAAATFDLAKAESIDGEWHAFECLVEGCSARFGSGPCFSAVVGSFYCVSCSPLFGLGM